MIKTLWYSLYVLLALLVIVGSAATVLAVVAAFIVSPWFVIGLPTGIVLTVSVARCAGWAVMNGIDA